MQEMIMIIKLLYLVVMSPHPVSHPSDPSSYMTNGAGDLPAYPVRVACGFMTTPQQHKPAASASKAAATVAASQAAATAGSVAAATSSAAAGSSKVTQGGGGSDEDDLWLMAGEAFCLGCYT